MQEQTLVSSAVMFLFFQSFTLTIVEGRTDFFTEPIKLDFMAGGEILLAGDVLIYDDLIDEALEYFVVTLNFQDPDNVPQSASIESNGGNVIRIDIIDNDGELKVKAYIM